MKDVLTTLGTLIDTTQKRDAIHIAIAPVVADMILYPGQGIKFRVNIESGAFSLDYKKVYASNVDPVGIVDPFLKGAVYPGQEFWMFLMPGSITSLRHDWTHPAFKDVIYVDEFEKAIEPAATEKWARPSPPPLWLTSFEDDSGLDHDELIDAGIEWVKYGNYKSDGGRWEGQDVPDEFWPYFETLTGMRVKENDRMSFFSCAC